MVNTDRLCMGCMNDNGGEQVCPICGYNSSEDNAPQYLGVGTWLNCNRYLVGKAIEETGDGVTYIGWDNDINAVVNIKEYFPVGIAHRSNDRLTVTPAENKGLAFNTGLEEFNELFSGLSKMTDSTGLLQITDTFESGGTVYAVQSTVSGTTLKAYLIRHGGTLKWEQIKRLFMPLFATVSRLNDLGIVHRGISPDNIIVARDGKLRLTGFSIKSARVDHSEFASQLASGYAAPEQYLENDESGASCDVYALGAVIFRALIGTTPADAKDRLTNDKLIIPTKVTQTVPKGALVAIANALKVDKTQRVGSVDRLSKMFEAVSTNTVVLNDVKKKEEKKKSSGAKYAIISVIITTLIFVVAILSAFFIFDLGSVLFPSEEPSNNSQSIPSPTVSSEPSSGYAPGTALFDVPDLVGLEYTEVYGDMQTEYSHFKFVVAGRMASDSVPRGSICKQSVEAGTKVERNTEIEIYISQGSGKVVMPKLIGKTLEEGKNDLFEAGFYSDTIIIRKGYDESAKPGEIYKVAYVDDETSVRAGVKISVNDLIVIYYRDPDTASLDSSGNSSSDMTSSAQ